VLGIIAHHSQRLGWATGAFPKRPKSKNNMGAKIYNSDLTKELREAAKIMTSVDATPTEIAEKVVPVMEVNPKILRRSNIVLNTRMVNNTAATIYTVPTDRDFYLVSAMLSFIKDATSTATEVNLRLKDELGISQRIMEFECLTLTAQADSMCITFPFPVKVPSGAPITINCTTNNANISVSGCIIGYTDSLIKA
jgi:hypothetical protein